MSAQISIKFNSAGFKEILMSEEMKNLIQSVSEDIAGKANANYGGDGFKAEVWQGAMSSKHSYGGRWIGSVSSTDRESAQAESEYKALSRAVT